jgi:hypothetical protein
MEGKLRKKMTFMLMNGGGGGYSARQKVLLRLILPTAEK